MGDRQIAIHLTWEQVVDFSSNGFQLCFACGVGDDPQYNVIAWTSTATANVNITWKENYSIAASTMSFMNGAKFYTSTETAAIQFQNVYTLSDDSPNGTISTDTNLAPNTFRFDNHTRNGVSAVVYKMINGGPTPVYFSSADVRSRGSEVLVPKSTVALWVQRDAETGTMISVNRDSIATFDMSGQSKLEVKWDGSRFVAQ